MLHSLVRPLAAAGLLACALPALGQVSNPIHEPAECAAPPKAMVTKVFCVSDVVTAPGGAKAPHTAETLMKAIKEIRPATWDHQGGAGKLAYYDEARALVVNQTPDVVADVASLLDTLRERNSEQVVIELRVVGVSGDGGRAAVAKLFEAPAEKACCEAACCDKPAGPKTACLTAAEVTALLERMTADRTANVMQAPKVTLFDGQAAPIAIVDRAKFTTGLDVSLVDGNPVMMPKQELVELGTTFHVSGTLSADRKHVKLGLKYRRKELASPQVPLHPVTTFVTPVFEGGSQGTPIPFTQFLQKPEFRELAFEQAVVVPDGGTVAVHAGRQTEQVRSEYGPPLISKIPYLNRLFKNVGVMEVERDVVVLATAKRVQPEPVKVVKAVVMAEPPRVCDPATLPMMRSFTVLTNPHPTPATHQMTYIALPGSRVVRAQAPQPATQSADLVAAYHAACAKGDKDAAMRLAVQALAQDPTCFSR